VHKFQHCLSKPLDQFVIETMVGRKKSTKTVTKIKAEAKKCLNKPEELSSPYPDYDRPYPGEVAAVVALMAEIHGIPERGEVTMPVLDSLVRTILSQNTTDKTSRVAFNNMKKTFPTYKSLLAAESADVEESIRCGGLAEIKTSRIKTICNTILSEYASECTDGEPSLEFLRLRSTTEVKKILSSFKGVGPKTISCVLMFNMARDEFPVDTHVWHIAKKLQWVPLSSTRETTYDHLNARIPNALKYACHVLFVEHGKCCHKCAKGGKLQHRERAVKVCPLTAENIKNYPITSPIVIGLKKKRVKLEDCDCVMPVQLSSVPFASLDGVGMSTTKKRLLHLDLQNGNIENEKQVKIEKDVQMKAQLVHGGVCEVKDDDN
jgi:endonuclease III